MKTRNKILIFGVVGLMVPILCGYTIGYQNKKNNTNNYVAQNVNTTNPNNLKSYTSSPIQAATIQGNSGVLINGNIYGWGNNEYGQLGNGTQGGSVTSPYLIMGPGAATDNVSTNNAYTQDVVNAGMVNEFNGLNTDVWAITSNGDLYMWGDNSYGQVGNPTNFNSYQTIGPTGGPYQTTPYLVMGPGANNGNTTNPIVAAGSNYFTSWAIDNQGNLYMWGLDNYGQVGNGKTGQSGFNNPQTNNIQKYVVDSPEIIIGPGAATDNINFNNPWSSFQVSSAGTTDGTSWAITTNGDLFMWGSNGSNVIGNLEEANNSNDRYFVQNAEVQSAPYLVMGPDVSNTTIIGNNWVSSPINSPVASFTTTQFSDIQGSDTSDFFNETYGGRGNNTSYAITQNGTLYSWGNNQFGQIGDGTTTNDGNPFAVMGPSSTGSLQTLEVNNIVANDWTPQALVTNTNGTQQLYSWGNNMGGQVGDGTTANVETPALVSGTANNVSSYGTMLGNSYYIDTNGDMYTWGTNSNGQQGNGTTTNVSTPTQITIPDGGVVILGGINIVNGWAITSSGQLWAWGNNEYGQLGNGTSGSTLVTNPTQVFGPNYENPDNTNVSVAYSLMSVSSTWTYDNQTGLYSFTPTAANFITIGTNNTVWMWGTNSNGEVADGSTSTNVSTPNEIFGANVIPPAITNFELISTGSDFAIAEFKIENQDNLDINSVSINNVNSNGNNVGAINFSSDPSTGIWTVNISNIEPYTSYSLNVTINYINANSEAENVTNSLQYQTNSGTPSFLSTTTTNLTDNGATVLTQLQVPNGVTNIEVEGSIDGGTNWIQATSLSNNNYTMNFSNLDSDTTYNSLIKVTYVDQQTGGTNTITTNYQFTTDESDAVQVTPPFINNVENQTVTSNSASADLNIANPDPSNITIDSVEYKLSNDSNWTSSTINSNGNYPISFTNLITSADHTANIKINYTVDNATYSQQYNYEFTTLQDTTPQNDVPTVGEINLTNRTTNSIDISSTINVPTGTNVNDVSISLDGGQTWTSGSFDSTNGTSEISLSNLEPGSAYNLEYRIGFSSDQNPENNYIYYDVGAFNTQNPNTNPNLNVDSNSYGWIWGLIGGLLILFSSIPLIWFFRRWNHRSIKK